MEGTILLADDSPQTLRMGREYLAGLGYAVLTATQAAAAMEAIAVQKPGLIVVDVALPGFAEPLGGVELCRRVKADPATRTTPVLLLLGALAQVAPQALTEADGILRKPLSSAGLERWLQGQAAAGRDEELTPDAMLALAVREAAEGHPRG